MKFTFWTFTWRVWDVRLLTPTVLYEADKDTSKWKIFCLYNPTTNPFGLIFFPFSNLRCILATYRPYFHPLLPSSRGNRCAKPGVNLYPTTFTRGVRISNHIIRTSAAGTQHAEGLWPRPWVLFFPIKQWKAILKDLTEIKILWFSQKFEQNH